MINQCDVAVVGGGLVGLSCALALGQRGFNVVLIEAQDKKKALTQDFDTKVVALTRASENFLSHLGVWQKILKSRYCAYEHIKVWDKIADGSIHFSAVDFFEPNLGTIVEHQILFEYLGEALACLPTVQCWTGATLEGFSLEKEGPTLLIKKGEETCSLKAALMIGADGVHSAVRTMNHIAVTESDYGQTALVATVQGTKPHYQTAFQRFSPEGPLALLPLSDPNTSSIVWTMSPEMAKMRCQASHAQVSNILTHESDHVMGTLTLVSDCFAFPLRTHHAKNYATPHCALVGDAAHTLHPLAGQGVNLGLLDVATLVEIIGIAKEANQNWCDLAVLKKYERARRLYNQSAIWIMALFKQGFGSRSWIIQQIRNQGLNWADRSRWLKQIFVNIALGKQGSIPTLSKPFDFSREFK